MIDRRTLIGLLCGALLIATPGVDAQPATKVPRVGWLGIDSNMQAMRFEAFKKGLRDLGYIEGKNITIETRWAEGQFDRLPDLAVELVASNVDVIITAAPPAVNAVRRATKTIPVVMSVHDPIGMGFALSLAKPGGNMTGVAFQDSELSTKRLDLLRQAVPNLTRVVVIWNRAGGGEATVKAVENAAQTLGLQTMTREMKEPGDFATAIAAAKGWGAQGMIQLASPFITKNRRILLDLLSANRLPATCEMRMYVAEGCLMTYSADLDAMFYREAYYVDRILKGANPGDLAIEQPREFEFVINDSTARALGLNISTSLRMQASEVIR